MFLSNIHVNMSGSDINTIYYEYFTKVIESYNKAFPIENSTKKSKNSCPWMTPRLKECIKKKAKLYREYLKGHISKREFSFITRHNLLTPSQFGFRKGYSTTNAIVKLLTHVVEAYHQKAYCACFFLDLRKAFDTINHKILLLKLEHYGFRGQCYKFLKSYYHNRRQLVHLNGYKSATMPVVNGVPQGSILGPLCFSLYINDLPLAVVETTALFADDAAFVLTARTLEELLTKIRNLFSDIAGYLDVNRLVPNATKSKLMMFTSRPTPNLPVVLFAGNEIEWVTEFKYLGLTITNNLCFSSHINKVALNLSRITGSFISLHSFFAHSHFDKIVLCFSLSSYPKSYCCMGGCPSILAKKFDSKNK